VGYGFLEEMSMVELQDRLESLKKEKEIVKE